MSGSASSAPAATRPRRRAGEFLTLRCGRMVHGGGCLAQSGDGETLLVDGAIPGELVAARLTVRRGGVWRARATEICEPSPDRMVPPCPYVPECGGCDLQHVAYPRQLELKRDVVVDAMRRARVPIPDRIPVHAMADPWRYRWRGEFHVAPGAGGMRDATLGFNRAHSWDPIAVDDCLIHHRAITDSLPALRAAVRGGGDGGLGALHLTVGEDGNELLVKARPSRALDSAALDDASRRLPPGLRWTTDSTTLRWRGGVARARAESFVQVNRAQMDVLYGRVLALLGDLGGRRVVDAYAGIGVLSAAIAASAAEVVCIEENRGAAQLGLLNARLAGVESRLRYRAEPVESALAAVAEGGGVDAVVLDPPRAGCAGSVTGWLALAGPARVVYVSCDAATLARDLHLLAASGPYGVRVLEVVDMFPQTHHVECVALLERG